MFWCLLWITSAGNLHDAIRGLKKLNITFSADGAAEHFLWASVMRDDMTLC
jgi:hypothetical protein